MWGRIYCKQTPCWLWHAINDNNLGLIYNLNVDIVAVYSDDNFAYHDIVPSDILVMGKINTQKIERKHLTFRTGVKRLARKTIC